MEYNINKGIGRNVEFNGLQAQYLYFFVGGLLAIFLLFVIFYMIGIDRWFCIGFGVLSAFSLIFGVFHLNKKYGPNGLMKLAAVKYHPSYIINRKRISSLFKNAFMRNILKAATLESKFPILSVEEGCILSKDADVTIGFKVFLPELFTVTSADYASMHGT